MGPVRLESIRSRACCAHRSLVRDINPDVSISALDAQPSTSDSGCRHVEPPKGYREPWHSVDEGHVGSVSQGKTMNVNVRRLVDKRTPRQRAAYSLTVWRAEGKNAKVRGAHLETFPNLAFKARVRLAEFVALRPEL